MKCTTPSFILELPLKVTSLDESIILTRFDIGRQVYNACVGESLKRLNLIQQSKNYKSAIKIPKGTKGSDNQQTRSKIFSKLNEEFGFREYDISEYALKLRSGWISKHLNSRLTQIISKRAFKAVQKKAFKKAKRVRFKSKNQFDSIEGNDNKTGLIFRNNTLNWNSLSIPCIIDKKNIYQEYGLNHDVKYCRVVRRKINQKNRFYLQLVLKGKPYQNHPIGDEEVGLDIGPSTIAYVGDTTAELKQFCNTLKPEWRKKRILQRKMDRSRRATNPDNYNENGTIKRGRKGRKFWTQSRKYKETQNLHLEHERKLAAHRKSLHGELANEILSVGNKIKTEKILYKAWQKMYGKSVLMRAPSMIVDMIQRKAENAHGGYLHEIPTYSTKLSQTCHICGAQVKKPLNERWHICCDIKMQRDLYSAFLAKCVDKTIDSLDITRANYLWSGLEPILNNAISRVEQDAKQSAISGNLVPASFGLAQRQSRSHFKPEITMTNISDVVIQYADESWKEVTVNAGISRL